jgi:hypothetical protein
MLEPWYFQDEVPTLYSEIVYLVPEGLEGKAWWRDPMNTGIQREVKMAAKGRMIRAWGKNLPAVPDEPSSLPFADMASRFMMVPTGYINSYGQRTELLKDWPSTCDFYAESYQKAGRKGKTAERKARELAGQAGSPTEQARAIHRFVRDEIETEDLPGVGLPEDASVDAVLTARRGDPAEKSLLLQTMLKAMQIDSRLVWVVERSSGTVDLEIANPQWFDRVIVAAQIDGQRVFLDPSDRSLGFGRLSPGLEGTSALLYDAKKPETLTLPVSRFDENVRNAKVELELDADGRLSGHGTLSLTGQHAWDRLDLEQDAAKVEDSWKTWLGDTWKGYDVKDVKVRQAVDEQRVEVSWSLAQRDEEVLGDEATLVPSRPWGPLHQPFPLPAARRVSPVLLGFTDRDDLELSLRWPEGWKPEALPLAMAHNGAVGMATVTVDVDPEARTLSYKRRLDIKEKNLVGAKLYQALQTLYNEIEKHDAQNLVLVHR